MLGYGCFLLVSLVASLSVARALPARLPVREDSDSSSEGITTLSTAAVSAIKPFTYYAGAAYCMPNATMSWDCGDYCKANPSFKPYASGGDGGNDTQFWYVGYDPVLDTIVVAHQGTDKTEINAILTNLDFGLTPLQSESFPHVPEDVEVHTGFLDAHEKSYSGVLRGIELALLEHSTNDIAIVGHSLGGAIATLQAIALQLHYPDMNYKTYAYGCPRVGNQAFADYVDNQIHSLFRIINKKDPIPILPGRFLGYRHASGEVQIHDSGEWVSCPGQDNTSEECHIGLVSNLFYSNIHDHPGPYDGVEIWAHCGENGKHRSG